MCDGIFGLTGNCRTIYVLKMKSPILATHMCEVVKRLLKLKMFLDDRHIVIHSLTVISPRPSAAVSSEMVSKRTDRRVIFTPSTVVTESTFLFDNTEFLEMAMSTDPRETSENVSRAKEKKKIYSIHRRICHPLVGL